MADILQNHSNGTSAPGGSGGRTARGESGRTAIQDARLRRRAIRAGWLGGERWATDATRSELTAHVAARGQATLKEKAVLTMHDDLCDEDGRIRAIAVKNVLTMEQQNMADELAERLDDEPVGTQEQIVAEALALMAEFMPEEKDE